MALAAMALAAMALAAMALAAMALAGPTTPVTLTRARPGEAVDHLMTHSGGDMEVHGADPEAPGWVIRDDSLTPSGKVFTGPTDRNACGPNADRTACPRWLDSQHLTQRRSYIPDNQVSTLQWRELEVLAAISLALAAFCGWWICRRVN
ncbi:hypothetical protein [Actinoplanes sp. NPDC051411]|uniref:hypothetical protein n=1 Tax=Actinoplanes sp. NPDC051411 TaxID=3155522 RepID=UPI003428A3E2